MILTTEQMQKIRLISDGDLYQDAEQLLAEHGTVERKQVAGLQDHARSFSELEQFVRHQGKERTWQGRKAHYQTFYQALERYLQELNRRVREQYQFVPENLSKNELRAQTSFFSGHLAQEFLQHLAAELVYKIKE
jgi:transposase